MNLLALLLAGAPDVLVLAPEEMQPALAEWRAHRESQGLSVEVRAPGDDPAATVREVHKASEGTLRFVLLVGDVEDVPCAYRQGEAIRIWESDPRIASDNFCADVDGDTLPDLAVGRLPADSSAQAKALLGRVLAYEKSRDFGPWRRRLNVVAGLAGFGAAADWAIENAARTLLTLHVPEWASLSVTWTNPDSPFCPAPDAVQDTVVERFNEGALVVTYLGHGGPHALDRLRVGSESYPIFERESVKRLKASHGAPIAFLVACSTGRFDGGVDCLAEEALLAPGGPIAVIASSRVSMPYGNGVLAKEMLDVLFGGRPATVGEWMVQAKRRFPAPAPGDTLRLSMDASAALLQQADAKKLALEREEHLYLYNLLGDPTMRLALPSVAKLRRTEDVPAGGRLRVVGTCGVQTGEALVELVEPRERTTTKAQGYERANRWEVAEVSVPVANGAFDATLPVPAVVRPGKYRVRVYVEGAAGAAAGEAQVTVTRAKA